MNLPMNLRGGVERLPAVLESVIARINTLWNKQHKLDGSHGKVTATKITTDAISVGIYKGIFAALRGMPLIGNLFDAAAKITRTELLSQGYTDIAGDVEVHVFTPFLSVESPESVAAVLDQFELAIYRITRISGRLNVYNNNHAINAEGDTHGALVLTTRSEPVNQRKWRIINYQQNLHFDRVNDLENVVVGGTVYFTPDGQIQAAGLGTTPINPANLPANIAYVNAGNVWTVAQTFPANTTSGSPFFISGPYGMLILVDVNAPVEDRTWRFLNYADGHLRVEALNSGGGVVRQFVFGRDGNFTTGGVYTPAGTVTAGTVTASGTVTGGALTTGGQVTCSHVEATFHLRAATGLYAGTDVFVTNYVKCTTGYGVVFDGTTARGMIRDGAGTLNIHNDNTFAINISAVRYLSLQHDATVFADVIARTTHLCPLTGNTRWLGHPTGFKWYSGSFYSAPSIGALARDMEILGEEPLGLRFINRLKPVAYRLKVDTVRPERRTKHGFVAQDLLETLNELGVEFDGVDADENHAALAYTELLAPMVKAMQEMSAQIDALKARVEALEGA